MYKKLLIIITPLFFFLIAMPVLSSGPNEFRTQITWPTSPTGRMIGSGTELHELIAYLYEWGIALGGIAVFIMLVWAGMEYLTSAGDPGKMTDAIKRIRSAIIGLVLLLSSWLILYTINPQLVQLRPLDANLWDDIENIQLEDGLDDLIRIPPCEFIVIYPQRAFRGTPGDPIRFQRKNPGKEILLIDSEDEIKKHSSPEWGSARSFIKISTDEEIDENNRFNEKGVQYNNGSYKIGGTCKIEFFYSTSIWWFFANVCGGRMGTVNIVGSGITDISAFIGVERISCVKAIRVIHGEDLVEKDLVEKDLVEKLFYVTADRYQGHKAEGVCSDGFHMCTLNEWENRERKKGPKHTAWFNDPNHNCNSWTTSDKSVEGKAISGNLQIIHSLGCAANHRVICCN